MKRQLGPDELTEKAAALALGAMDSADESEFAELVAQDPAAEAELRSFCEVVEALAYSAPQADPSPAIRQKLMSNLGEQDPVVVDPDVAASERRLVRSGEGTWREVEPGVRVKVLYQDEHRRTFTSLVQMEAGSKIPRHYHDGGEECYVISGDIYDDQMSMQAGDYIALMRDTMHSVVATVNGAMLLVVSPMGQDGGATV